MIDWESKQHCIVMWQRAHHENADALEWFNLGLSPVPWPFEPFGQILLRESSNCGACIELFAPSTSTMEGPLVHLGRTSNVPIKSIAPEDGLASSSQQLWLSVVTSALLASKLSSWTLSSRFSLLIRMWSSFKLKTVDLKALLQETTSGLNRFKLPATNS